MAVLHAGSKAAGVQELRVAKGAQITVALNRTPRTPDMPGYRTLKGSIADVAFIETVPAWSVGLGGGPALAGLGDGVLASSPQALRLHLRASMGARGTFGVEANSTGLRWLPEPSLGVTLSFPVL